MPHVPRAPRDTQTDVRVIREERERERERERETPDPEQWGGGVIVCESERVLGAYRESSF